MGWEVPEMNIGEMKIRNLSLIASNIPTDVQSKSNNLFEFNLTQNYPNPFNPSTTIKYSIPDTDVNVIFATNVTLKVYDVLGNKVSSLVNKKQNYSNYEIVFNIDKLTSGIYFYKLVYGNNSKTKKLIILK